MSIGSEEEGMVGRDLGVSRDQGRHSSFWFEGVIH